MTFTLTVFQLSLIFNAGMIVGCVISLFVTRSTIRKWFREHRDKP